MIRLTVPSVEYAEKILDFKHELTMADESFSGCSYLEDYEDILTWIEKTKLHSDPETCPEDRTPASTFLAVREEDDRIVGIIDLRHNIKKEALRVWAGHMGYSVRPSERRKGYAKEMLRLNLDNARAIGIEKLLLTCNEDNIASEKTILANGGVLESIIEVNGKNIKRFWITL